jgi:hypothetical protein
LNAVFAAALQIQKFCQQRDWRFCVIGGLAVQRWGEPRLTLDADITLLTGFGEEPRYVDALLQEFGARRSDARDFALRYRVLLLLADNGVALDIALGAMPFEERATQRASAFTIEDGQSLLTCSAEDLVVFKAFAGRDKDWLDIEGVVTRQAAQLDEQLVWRELAPLLELKDTPESAARLRSIFARAAGSQA